MKEFDQAVGVIFLILLIAWVFNARPWTFPFGFAALYCVLTFVVRLVQMAKEKRERKVKQ